MILRQIAILLILAMTPVLSWGQGGADIEYSTKSARALEHFNEGLEKLDNFMADEARECFATAVAADPEFAMAYFEWANNSANTADFLKRLEMSVELAPKASEVERLVIMSAKAQNDGENRMAEEYIVQAVGKYPGFKRVRLVAGNFYFGQQNFEMAEREYRQAISIDPNFAASYNILAYLLSNQDRYEEAIETLRQYAALRPNDPNPRDSMGEIYLWMGDHKNSFEAYNSSLKIDPGFVASFAGLGHNHSFMGEFDKARDMYMQLRVHAASAADTNTCYFWTGTSYCHEKKHEQAIRTLEEQLEYVRKHNDSFLEAVIWGQIGEIHRELGNGSEAIRAARMERETAARAEISQGARDNFLRDAIFTEGEAFARMGMPDSARVRLLEYSESAKAAANPIVTANLNSLEGIVAYYLKDNDRAIVKLSQANRFDPISKFYLALAFEGAGKAEDAENAFAKLLSFNRNSLSYGLVRPWAAARVKQS